MKAVLIFDADNTIWDTDAVFRGAQLALLKTFAKAELITQPDLQLKTLRTLDQALVNKLGQAEYDFKLLSTALACFYSQKSTLSEAVDAAVHAKPVMNPILTGVCEEAYQAFKRELRRVPPLYPETIPVLSAIRASASEANSLVTILHSEGNHTRLEHILEAHNIWGQRLFDEIIIAPKSKEAFEQAKGIGLRLLSQTTGSKGVVFVLIGDSLHRDIKFGNQAGFITVYKPSAFKGFETPNTPDEQPCYTIQSLGELPTILKEDLGLPIQSPVQNRLY